ncbi:MAG TPA: [FeFe] hydrogenase, group A [Ignavibacteria bacterium]|nr:[FeFe] hydrogenase, group A [Ignavibacteria bacterium]
MESNQIIYINGREIKFENERNLLEVIRKANIEIPTFCYHSELSVYGACRLCLVEIEGRGLVSSCSIKPEAGMKIKTHTKEIREIRKIALELLLANHDNNCTSCIKSNSCKLQEIAAKLGVDKIRFKSAVKNIPLDFSSEALVRDPNKCILCGDCVRACEEIQGIGAIDFAYRGSDVAVMPAFNKMLSKVECVDCGQCARVCPTGAITPKLQIDEVWEQLENKSKIVAAQIAPAVRVAIGEMFNIKSGEVLAGQINAALKMMGFKYVFDTSFGADLTVLEEAAEFKRRLKENKNLPLMSSCCPAWIKYAEQYYPEYLDNLSTCKSPQQMLGAVIKETIPATDNVKPEDVIVVSIMPCTAKKFEAYKDGNTIKDTDYVLTTQELGMMIKQAGIDFVNLFPESFDMPYGFKTGAGVIFGNSGGVTEAVLRYVQSETRAGLNGAPDIFEVRDNKGIKEIDVRVGSDNIKVAVVSGLKNAKNVLGKIKRGEVKYDFIEVMACPGGCVGGAGQPVCFDDNTRNSRTKGLYEADKMLQLHNSQDNPYVKELYDKVLNDEHKAHTLLHTGYQNRKRILEEEISLIKGSEEEVIDVNVCVGTSCYLKGSQDLLHKMINYIDEKELNDYVNVKATFCFENCDNGPTVSIGSEKISKCTLQKAINTLEKKIEKISQGV